VEAERFDRISIDPPCTTDLYVLCFYCTAHYYERCFWERNGNLVSGTRTLGLRRHESRCTSANWMCQCQSQAVQYLRNSVNPQNTHRDHVLPLADGLELKSHCTSPETVPLRLLFPDAHPPSCPSTGSPAPLVSSWGRSCSKPSSNTILSGSSHRRYPPPHPPTRSLTTEGGTDRH